MWQLLEETTHSRTDWQKLEKDYVRKYLENVIDIIDYLSKDIKRAKNALMVDKDELLWTAKES